MHVAQAIVVVPVTGWVDELRQSIRALLHEQPGDGPVGFAAVEVVSGEYAVDDFIGLWVADRQHDVFDQATVAGNVYSVDFGGYVVPVVSYRFDAPVFAAKDEKTVKSVLINIDLPTEPIETNRFISGEHQIQLYVR